MLKKYVPIDKRLLLTPYFGVREVYTGRFADTGIAYDSDTRKYSRTILVREIVSAKGELVTDHAWIKPEVMPTRDFGVGELISYKADIEKCYTGYREKKRLVGNRNIVYGYAFTNVELVENA